MGRVEIPLRINTDNPMYRRGYEDAVKAVTTGWIPVEYDLPELGERVIATDGYIAGEAYYSDQGNWMRYSNARWPDRFGFPVTHWMRMPEMPEGVKNENI